MAQELGVACILASCALKMFPNSIAKNAKIFAKYTKYFSADFAFYFVLFAILNCIMVSVETFKHIALSFEGTEAKPHFNRTAFKVSNAS